MLLIEIVKVFGLLIVVQFELLLLLDVLICFSLVLFVHLEALFCFKLILQDQLVVHDLLLGFELDSLPQ
jgi:hypothetical protein